MKALDAVDVLWAKSYQEIRMSEPWKTIVCDAPACFFNSVEGSGAVKPGARIYPEIDTPELVQFRCPECGKIEVWGATRCAVAKTLYERFSRVRVSK
jgi:hypothetical protein